jgi:hypothetical protein
MLLCVSNFDFGMKKSQFWLLAVILIFAGRLDAQNGDLFVFKLKSGLEIKGELLKVIPDSCVVLRQYGLETTINISEISSIKWSGRTEHFIPSTAPLAYRIANLPDSGFYMGASIGGTVGITDVNEDITSSFSVQLSALYFVKPRLLTGVSLLLDPYGYYSQAIFSPVVDVRYFPMVKRRKSPLIYGHLGYGFNITSPALGKHGGINTEFGLGFAKSTRNHNVFLISAGVKYQEFKRKSSVVVWPNVEDRIYHYQLTRVLIKFGWLF